jgi:hypothetical protein
VIGPVATGQVGFERSLSAIKLEAKLALKVLATLVASELATKTHFNVIQVIAEHAALGEQATDEVGPSDDSEGDA